MRRLGKVLAFFYVFVAVQIAPVAATAWQAGPPLEMALRAVPPSQFQFVDWIEEDRRESAEKGVQDRLKRAGFYDGAVDGAWGPQSSRALGAFYDAAGLTGDYDTPKDYLLYLTALVADATGLRRADAVAGAQAVQSAADEFKAADAAMKAGRLDEAEKLIRQVLATEEQYLTIFNDRSFETLQFLVDLMYRKGEIEEALALSERAIAVAEEGRGPTSTEALKALDGQVQILKRLERLSEAEDLAWRVYDRRKSVFGERDPSTLWSMGRLGEVLRLRNDCERAIPLYRSFLGLSPDRDLTPNSEMEHAMTALGDCLRIVGEMEEASSILRQVIDAREASGVPDDLNTAVVYYDLALTLQASGETQKVEELFRKTWAIESRIYGEDHPETIKTAKGLASFLALQNRNDEALEIFRTLFPVALENLPISDLSVFYLTNSYSVTLVKSDVLEEATMVLEKVIQKYLDASIEGDLGTLILQQRLAHTYRELGKTDLAIDVWTEALSGLKLYFAGGHGANTELLRERLPLKFDEYLEALYERADDPRARAASFYAQGYYTIKSVDFALEDMSARNLSDDLPIQEAIRAYQQAYSRYWAEKVQDDLPTDAADTESLDTEAIIQRLDDRSQLGAELDQRFAELTQLDPHFRLTAPLPLNTEWAHQILNNEEGLLLTAVTDDALYVWLIKKPYGDDGVPVEYLYSVNDGPPLEWRRTKIARDELANRVSEIRSTLDLSQPAPPAGPGPGCALRSTDPRLAGRDFDICAAQALYELVFGDLDLTGIDRLIVVPDGPLQELPFSLMVTGRDARGGPHWLIEDLAKTTLPSTSAFWAVRGPRAFDTFAQVPDPADNRKAFLGFAPVDFGGLGGATPLRSVPGSLESTGEEVALISALLGSGRDGAITGSGASESFVKTADLSDVRVLSFATHSWLGEQVADATSGRISEPALLLAATPGEDGLLTASEIATLRLDADWVLLSACNTASPGTTSSDSLSGLSQAFFFAGARGVLVSHWYVDDVATSDLMTSTVEKASEGMNKSHALRQAMLSLMQRPDRDFAHPFFWAPFVFVGDGAAEEEFEFALRGLQAIYVPGEGFRAPVASEAVSIREAAGIFGISESIGKPARAPSPNLEDMTDEEYHEFLDEFIKEREDHPFALMWPLNLHEPTPNEARYRKVARANDPPATSPSALADASQTALQYLDKALAISEGENGQMSGALMLGITLSGDSEDGPTSWVTNIARTANGFEGRILETDKILVSRFKLPNHISLDTVEFSRGMIRDWGLVGAEQRVFGRFTTRIEVERLPDKFPDSKVAETWLKALSEDPLPSGW